MSELCIIPNDIDCQSVISVEPVGLINGTSLVAVVHQHLQPASLRLARSLTFCNRARGGSCVEQRENASATKVTNFAFKIPKENLHENLFAVISLSPLVALS